jgi:transglutaminase-like putative cysteine protease
LARHCFPIVLLLCLSSISAANEDPERDFTFSYLTEIGPIPAGEGPVHVFVPLPVESDQQQVLEFRVDASLPGQVETEDVHGNRFWHGQLPESNGEPIRVEIRSRVKRSVYRGRSASPVDARYLAADSRVPVGHPILDPILAEIRTAAASDDPERLARATYDWVVDNVEYKKVGAGWGNGDTFWACSERYGNCTDFHALFISLARTLGIPARFEIGFPVPEDRSDGEIAGYHCWVEFQLPSGGWLPIDASEAFKNPEKREMFFGTHPADRIHFSTGRDLRLGEAHRGAPLNYFVYPHVEVAGEPFDGEIARSFRFQEG